MTIGTDIAAKVTSWYDLNGNLNDSKGVNNLVTGVSVSYEAGKNGMQRAAAGSRGAKALASPIPITVTTQKAFIGGWVYYDGTFTPNRAEFSLGKDFNGNNEMLALVIGSPGFVAFGWEATPPAQYSASDPLSSGVAYPFTVRCEDSLGQVAESPQIITVRNTGGNLPEGWYFGVAQWDEGDISVYSNGELAATNTDPPTSVRNATMNYFQIGNQYGPVGSQGALQYVFFGSGNILTDDEITWLYNLGNGRAFADLV